MAAEAHQVISAAIQCLIKIEGAKTTAGSFPVLVHLSEEDGRFVEAFDEAGGDETQ